VRRMYLAAVPGQVPGALPAATRRCRSKRKTLGR
jgi:hypothetical protein